MFYKFALHRSNQFNKSHHCSFVCTAENQSEEEEEEEEDDEEEEAMGSSYTEHSFEFIDFMKK